MEPTRFERAWIIERIGEKETRYIMEAHERKKVITWADPSIIARDASSISGLDFLRALIDGSIERPPVARLIGYEILKVEEGSALFRLNPEECHYNPFLMVHGGILSLLLDSTMTASVMTRLPVGVHCSTAEIKVNFVRPVRFDSGPLLCEGETIHMGSRLATAQGRVRDAEGRLYAHGTTTCVLTKVGEQP